MKWSKAMNEPIDPELLEEVERYEKLQQDVIESVRKNTINDLIEAQQVAEELVTKINLDYPKPPTLEELMSIVQEEANELVQTQPKQISVTEETPTPASKPAKTLAEKAVQHITNEVKLEEKADSFQQPNPKSVDKNLDAVQKKLKFLEQAIGRIAAIGPGGGAVNLKDLDDVDYASITTATNNQVLTFNAASNLWISKSITGGAGIPTLDEVTTQGNTTTNDITIGSATADYFAVNTTAGYTVTTGQIAWNSADLTFDMGMANGVTLQVGQEQYIKVKADNVISDGQVVMFAGATGEHILGTPSNLSSPGFRPEYIIGVATQNIAKNSFGYITTFGKVHGLNTQAFNLGDLLYASPTSTGSFTTTEPQPPYSSILIATVAKKSASDGHILVRPTYRFDLRQLNDVYTTSPTDGQTLIFQNNVWYNRNITSANVTELTNLFYTNARVYANVLTLDHATNAQLANYATNNQLSLYSTNAQAANFATLANINLKANVVDLTTANVSENNSNLYFTNARVYANVTTLGYVANTYVNTRLQTKANVSDLTTANIAEVTNLYFTNARVYSNVTQLGYYSNSTVITNNNTITSNATTAFVAGDAAISGVALQLPSEGALRNLTNGFTNMYFDVSIGGTTQGQFQFRSSSAYTNVLTMSPTVFNVNTGATVTARTPSLARTAFNSAIDTEITVDEMRFRISNQAGIFPQVIGNSSSRNLAWTGVGACSGAAVTQVGSTGTIVASNAWTTLYNAHGMDSPGDTITVTLQDKAAGRIYRITFMRSDNGTTTGYNIVGERLL